MTGKIDWLETTSPRQILSIKIILLILSVIAVTGCTSNRNITMESRFKNVIRQPIHSKIPLRIYENHTQLATVSDRCELSEINCGEDHLIGFLPAGHAVEFTKAFRRNGIGGSWEYLEGTLNFKDKRYPIAYYLGISEYPDGWKRMYDSFQIEH